MAPCPVAERELIALPLGGLLPNQENALPEPSVEPFISATLPSGLTPRHLWFFLWLPWFLLFLRRWQKS